MDIEKMQELGKTLLKCKHQLHAAQYEIAIVLAQEESIMNAIEAGIVKPCIPMDILRQAMKSHGDLKRLLQS